MVVIRKGELQFNNVAFEVCKPAGFLGYLLPNPFIHGIRFGALQFCDAALMVRRPTVLLVGQLLPNVLVGRGGRPFC